MTDNKNTGNRNSGYCNTGNYNSGNRNTGNYNSGNYNSGSYNSGSYNSGSYNSGYCNSGDYNSGDYNSGYCNSGNYNSGDYNSGSYNNGFFNTDESTIRLFNKDTGKKRNEIIIPYIELKTTEWVSETKMSDAEKKDNPQFHIAGGFLKERTYKEAWMLAWPTLTDATKQQFFDLPNFDADIFFEITGVDVRKTGVCADKIVEIDGKKYRLEEIK